EEAARHRDNAALGKDRGCVGVEGKPPPEEGRGIIDRPAHQLEPWGSELRLKAEPPCCPLCRRPGHDEHDGQDNGDLTPENSATTHTGSNRQKCRSRSEN